MHEGEGFMTRLLELLGDPAHWVFEFTGEAVTTAVAYPLIRLAVRLHDRKFHPTHKAEEA